MKFEKEIYFLHPFQVRTNARALDYDGSNPKSLNHIEMALSLSIYLESLENLFNVFWVIFSVFQIENFKKLAYISVNIRLNDIQNTSISLRISAEEYFIRFQNRPSIQFSVACQKCIVYFGAPSSQILLYCMSYRCCPAT